MICCLKTGQKRKGGCLLKTAGIIAEFNPFHNGHAYLIEKARENGCTHIIAVMSGNYVQRGEPAVFPDFVRAETALQNGVDLVLSLPLPYAVSGASVFSSGGVSVLEGTGAVDELVFASESGNIEDITEVSRILSEDRTDSLIMEQLSSGITYAAARENAVREIIGGKADILSQPNNILAVEYVSALNRLKSSIKPVTFLRQGPGYNDGFADGEYASASEIRRLIQAGEEWKKYVPDCENYRDDAKCVPVDLDKYSTAVLYRMRMMSADELSRVPDVSEGLENRISAAAASASSLEELLMSVKTKRYTLSRIRRIVLSAFLGIESDDVFPQVPYIRIMGFNDRGAELIRKMKKTVSLPIVTKAGDISKLDKEASRLFFLESRASDIYSLFSGNQISPGSGKSTKVIDFSEKD